MQAKLKQLKRQAKQTTQELGDSEDSNDAAETRESSSSPSEGEEAPPRSARDQKILAERKTTEAARSAGYVNKQRVMVLCSRGVGTRHRHLMEDMRALLPHHRREVKHDSKRNLHELNELCELKSCNGCLFFEVRKKKDLYLWASRTPTGPSLKFLVSNVHTMDELRLTGNCLLGSRPILSFTEDFEGVAHLQLVKEVLALTFGTPKGHPKSKPFVDRVMQFSYLDGRIWVRNYQIVDKTVDPRELKKAAKQGEETTVLVEIGPRFVLTLIKVFEGGFSGRPLYENIQYQSPNTVRSLHKRALGQKYATRKSSELESRKRHKEVLDAVPVDPLANVFR